MKARVAPDLSKYYFDEIAASASILFIERFLHHSKGEWAGKPFLLQTWQKEIIGELFGWKRISDGLRRFSRAYLEIPRKNGKSTICAALASYMLHADGEPGSEIYSAAADREQARIVFEETKNMITGSQRLNQLSECYRNSILVPTTLSSYKVLSADAHTKHGFNAQGVIIDELHAQQNRELYDVLSTSMGSRRQPLLVMITTAGFDRESVCWEQHEYARQVLEGVIDDPTFYASIYAAEDKDDWTDPAVWHKANPNLGVTIKEEFLREECERAKLIPAYQNTFRRLYLNQWTQQETRFIPMDLWEKGSEPKISEESLAGALCYGGLDLASTSDLAAFVMDFPPDAGDERELHALVARFWIPEMNMMERERKDRVPYSAWARAGWIKVTEGNVIDYQVIIRDIIELSEKFNLGGIAYDRWGAERIRQELAGAGLTLVAFGQGFKDMSAPTKELLRLVMDGKLKHGGNPVLRWNADNVMVMTDAAGNMKPDKAKSREKIDGIVASVMAVDLATRSGGKSVYESRGIVTI
jgi:phage terminase large subunit-like protein